MQQPIKTYYTLSVEEVIDDLGTDAKKGLTEEEAAKRLLQYGKNEVQDKDQKSILRTLLEQFSNPIVWILIIAAGLAFVYQHTLEGIAVLIVILINTLIGFFMERQAIRSMEKLKSMARSKAMVLRDGNKVHIDSVDLVPGDLLTIQAGDVITADARIISQNNLALKESALTGESTQVEKNTKPLPEDTQVADRANTVFKGTAVSRGNGIAAVVATASQTELGKITGMAQEAQKEATPLNKKLRALSVRLIWLTLALAVLIFVLGIIRGETVVLMIETAIALAIASIPEGLPVISTLSLARGMLGMAKKNVIVKTLEAVQTLGETEVIFTDKTGTLTENEMHVQAIAFDETIGNISDEEGDREKLKKHPAYDLFLKVAILCNNGSLEKGKDHETKSSGDPEEVALLRMANGLSENVQNIRQKYPRIGEVPFDSEIKMMGTVNESGKEYLVGVKGAVEEVLEKCTKIYEEGKERDFDDKNEWKDKADELASRGLRVLSFAYRISEKKPEKENFIHDLVFLGIAGFIDPARQDVKESIRDCKDAGIRVVMVTGDHPGTANAIARAVGLTDGDEVVNVHGKELLEKDLSKETMDKVLQASVFSRVDPGQKLDLVSIYQKKKIIVGMTGDGVNDAPALKKADIGIAMGIRGTEAAKEAADLIINDDAFTSVVTAIQYGRVIFDNIRTFVVYLLSCNLSEIMIVALASFMNLPMPLLPLQILFLNMITDVFPALAIGMSKGEPELVMKRSPRKSSEPIVSRRNWISIGVYALCLTVGALGAEIYVLSIPGIDDKVVNNVTFCTLILAQLWNVFNMPERQTPFFINQITRNKYVWLAIIFCVASTIVIYLFPALRSALSLVSFEPKVLAVIIVASLVPVALIQLLKRVFRIIG
jgi:Ca2+-transporting ATPase